MFEKVIPVLLRLMQLFLSKMDIFHIDKEAYFYEKYTAKLETLKNTWLMYTFIFNVFE